MDISTNPPLFLLGVKKCEILPCFSTPLAFRALEFKTEKNEKSKTTMYSADV